MNIPVFFAVSALSGAFFYFTKPEIMFQLNGSPRHFCLSDKPGNAQTGTPYPWWIASLSLGTTGSLLSTVY